MFKYHTNALSKCAKIKTEHYEHFRLFEYLGSCRLMSNFSSFRVSLPEWVAEDILILKAKASAKKFLSEWTTWKLTF